MLRCDVRVHKCSALLLTFLTAFRLTKPTRPMLIAQMSIQLITTEERLITKLTKRVCINRTMLTSGRTTVLEMIEELWLTEEFMFVYEHLSCCYTRFTRVK